MLQWFVHLSSVCLTVCRSACLSLAYNFWDLRYLDFIFDRFTNIFTAFYMYKKIIHLLWQLRVKSHCFQHTPPVHWKGWWCKQRRMKCPLVQHLQYPLSVQHRLYRQALKKGRRKSHIRCKKGKKCYLWFSNKSHDIQTSATIPVLQIMHYLQTLKQRKTIKTLHFRTFLIHIF